MDVIPLINDAFFTKWNVEYDKTEHDEEDYKYYVSCARKQIRRCATIERTLLKNIRMENTE